MKNSYKKIAAYSMVAIFIASLFFVGASIGHVQSAPGRDNAMVTVQKPVITGNTKTFGNFELINEESKMNLNATVTVTLSFKNSLSSYINEISNPSSPFYRNYMNVDEIGSEFGLSQSTYNMIASYFSNYNIKVYKSPARLTMSLSGTVSQFDKAFNTKIGAFAIEYKSKGMWIPLFGSNSGLNGNVSVSPLIYVNTGDLSLPEYISQYIGGISGLDGAMAAPALVMPFNMTPKSGVQPSITGNGSYNNPYTLSQIQNITYANYTWALNSETPTDAASENPSGGYQFLFPSTMHVLTGASNLWSGKTTIDSEPDLGQGITVAVIEVGDLPMSWLQEFAKQVWNNSNQVTSRLSVINLLGANLFDGYIYGWTLETALDIEYIAAMAPDAHIDLVAVPNPDFSSFDYAYQYIADHLTSGNNATDSVTITSNSYGADEITTALKGAPMYITVEDTLLSELNAVGVTNFFASGDYGSYASLCEYGATSAGMPAIATGSTSVGGGQLTAESNGIEFPDTGVYALSTLYNIEMQVAPATGVASFTYWSYGLGFGGTYKGYVGGGFGQSAMLSQPWWQNALDTYSSGARMDPVISGSAAFNMSVYTGIWNIFYGGTSFATPISAGEWALIEEQAKMAYGTAAMGDINPLLYGAHNAYEAHVTAFYNNPFIDMENIGRGFNYGPVNSFDWYYFNLSINEPSDPVVPWWTFTINGPEGNGWSYLQGLGMIKVNTMDLELIGQLPTIDHSLLNEPFKVLMVTPSGLEPFTYLQGGKTYTFKILLSDGQPGSYYTVEAYSGGADNGVYGGGNITMITTNSNGMFNYTPVYNYSSPSMSASEYGYFYVTTPASSYWSFSQFAVKAKNETGNLTLGVTNALGDLSYNVAEVPMFTDTMTGYYNYFGATGIVELNGMPVSGAVVHEVSLNNSEFSAEDSGLPVSSYAPGVQIGTFLSDGRGMFNYWTDSALAEFNGPLYTQVEELYATYGNLTSNKVIVYIEPQAGNFYPDLHIVSGKYLVGNVEFSDMKYVNFVNISIGSAPGEYKNVTFAPEFYDYVPELYFVNGYYITVYKKVPVSGIFNGIIPVNLTIPSGKLDLRMVASGYNDLSFEYSFFGFVFSIQDIQSPIVWSDPYIIFNAGTLPHLDISGPSGMVSGNITLNYNASSNENISSSVIEIAYAGGYRILRSDAGLSGSININTLNLPDGYYMINYIVTTNTGLTSKASDLIYIDNTAEKLQAELNNIMAEYNSTVSELKQLQSRLTSEKNLNSNLTLKISELNNNLSLMKLDLVSMESRYNATYTELESAQANLTKYIELNASNTVTINNLENEISDYKANITMEKNTISSLESKISSMQAEIYKMRHPTVTSIINDIGGYTTLIIIGLMAVVIGLIIAYRKK
ncbi:S53 family peptidase [Picrophilus oshimae]|uniref:Subtilase family protein n=1 Tax=Picrophilus torridus (strain ATCC 700027 / DSM 9790 / JCM 10055 / NBRC 100828 / KAW 2/3) TaxID=1122961 RepID=Q6L067_PICTO|nr:protease pro-enzyme activation domain-containing protein [Picrophilus oshimae]AAT43635.1 subtilase family protein [Picrophilus oshimae DSM 9789]